MPIGERGKLMSLLLMCAYLGTTPTVVLGYLGDAIGLTATLTIFSLFAIGIATFVILVGSRLFPEVIPYRAPAAPAAPSGAAPGVAPPASA